MQKLSFEEAKAKIPQDIELIFYAGSVNNEHSVFLDKTVNLEFESSLLYVVRGRKHFLNKNFVFSPKNIEEAKLYLEKKNAPSYITIIFFAGSATNKQSIFLDEVYGEFTGSLSDVACGIKKHPLRKIADRKNMSNPYLNEEVRRKHLEGCKKRDYSYLEKTKSTLKEKYGIESPLQKKEFLDKAKSTNFSNYGVDSFSKTDAWREKMRELNPAQSEDFKSKNLSSKVKSGVVKTYEGKTLKEYAESISKAYITVQAKIKKYGFETAAILFKNNSLELKIKDFLIKNEIIFLNNKKVFSDLNIRPDFFIPSHSIVIECNGNFWHSDLNLNKTYHQDRMKVLNEKGVRTFFFTQDEILLKSEIIYSILSNAFKLNINKFYARKLLIHSIKDVTFFEENHLMGKGKGTTLFLVNNNNEKIAGIQYTIKKTELNIERFCTLKFSSVVGGFSKLIAYIIKQNPIITKIVNFVDLRYGNGEHLKQLGFVVESEHLSFNWINPNNLDRFHRMKYPKNEGYRLGLAKLWDCGQRKYVKYITQ